MKAEFWDIYDCNGMLTGRKIRRGERLLEGEYHLISHVWIFNDEKQFLIQKRNKPLRGATDIWACTGGAALCGETGIEAALRETEEEMGIILRPDSLYFLDRSFIHNFIQDLWIAKWNGDVSDIVFDPEEVKDVAWKTLEELREMIDGGEFYDFGCDYFTRIMVHVFSGK